jgi:hypothetical protein
VVIVKEDVVCAALGFSRLFRLRVSWLPAGIACEGRRVRTPAVIEHVPADSPLPLHEPEPEPISAGMPTTIEEVATSGLTVVKMRVTVVEVEGLEFDWVTELAVIALTAQLMVNVEESMTQATEPSL